MADDQRAAFLRTASELMQFVETRGPTWLSVVQSEDLAQQAQETLAGDMRKVIGHEQRSVLMDSGVGALLDAAAALGGFDVHGRKGAFLFAVR
eukprot:2401375-Rhodomonas_salina.1